jgi:3-oxoacyl-[acyl-carrier protein] reductase
MRGEAEGKNALVTGAGAPDGIGFATARVLGREGARLAIASTTGRIHDRAEELRELGYPAAGFVAELTDPAQARGMVDAVLKEYGAIDILVNNAGMVNVGMDAQPGASFLSLDDAEWELDIALNLHTAYHVTRAAVPGMVERGWGRVVMVSSVTGPLVTDPGSAASFNPN